MKIDVLVNLSSPQHKYIAVEYSLTFPQAENEILLKFPVWSPGSYLVREYAANVEDFSVSHVSGRKQAFEKTDKSTWKIFPEGARKIKVSYRVYAGDLSVRGVYADHRFVFVNMPALLFYPEGGLGQALDVHYKLPRGWKLAVAKEPRGNVYHFDDFDEAYDTPLLAGADLEFYHFRLKNTRFEVAVQGLYDSSFAKITPDLKKIIASQIGIFKSHPCRRYVFQVIFGQGLYGGLEHRASSSNVFDGLKLAQHKEYQKFLALLAHEHFHLWNIKRIRPRALGPFDYCRENYTRELWIAEGVTSFYDDHTVYRAGVYSRDDYLVVLTENLHKLENQYATRVNSLSDSSFDAWTRFYRQNENSINRVTSYYLKGGLVMLLLDLDIIRRSNGKHTLDDVMRALFEMYRRRPDMGITREEFFAAAKKITGHDYARFVRDFIDGVVPVAWNRELRDFGLLLRTNENEAPYFAGFILKDDHGRVLIDKVSEGSPAYDSQMQAGDELLAINGIRFSRVDQMTYFLKEKKWRVIFARHGKTHECHFELVRNEKFNKTLVVKKRLSAHERRLLNRFLRK